MSEDGYQIVYLDGGETVRLYGTPHSSFYVCDNGYITFGSGDSDYTPTLEDHFDLPRISALFNDFSVAFGTVSWKQLADRAVVSYENVPDYGTSNNNTFQVELFFNGDIHISYLNMDSNDGIVGLSEGNGLDPDFYATDLSAMGACAALTIVLPEGTPWRVDPETPTTIAVQIDDGGETVVPGSETLHYRFDPNAPEYLTSPLTPLGGNLYQATLPAAACGQQPEFYFSATGDGGTTVYEPLAAPASVYSAIVATLTVILDDDFESDQGWTVENTDLGTGAWERGIPVNCDRGDPPSDYDGSGQCYLTDNDAVVCNSDVDGGPTRLISPIIDLSGTVEPVLRYACWFTCDDDLPPAADFMDVEVSNDDGGSWHLVETVAHMPGWVYQSVDLADYIEPTDQVRIRFNAMDNPNNSIVEAGIDALWIFDLACVESGIGDIDGDGDVDLEDLAALLAAYGTCEGDPGFNPAADLDDTGCVDLADLATLLAHYGEGT